MNLLPAFIQSILPWRSAFAKDASFRRFVAVLLGLLAADGQRRTVTSSIRFRGHEHHSWSADYLVFSRAEWDINVIMSEVFAAGLRSLDTLAPGLPVVLALDDTSIRKASRVIDSARWMRDPLSPAFHMNLTYGLRYLHTALLLPLHRVGFDPRAISVGFELAPSLRKPGRKASVEEQNGFREKKKQANLSQMALETIKARRAQLDELDGPARPIRMVGDGSYTNKVVLRGLPENVEYIGRTRKNLALHQPATPGGRKIYGERLPTPAEMRSDDNIPYTTAELHYGGATRAVRYKQVSGVLWRTVGRRPLRLIILAPTPYTPPAGSRKKKAYGQPAYLLTTDLKAPAPELIQSYLDRWQIEVVHRDLKAGLGVGEAQVWSPESVRRLNTALVGTWSMMTLAAISAFGPARTDVYGPLPAWRRKVRQTHRASQQDIVKLMRQELAEAGRRRAADVQRIERVSKINSYQPTILATPP